MCLSSQIGALLSHPSVHRLHAIPHRRAKFDHTQKVHVTSLSPVTYCAPFCRCTRTMDLHAATSAEVGDAVSRAQKSLASNSFANQQLHAHKTYNFIDDHVRQALPTSTSGDCYCPAVTCGSRRQHYRRCNLSVHCPSAGGHANVHDERYQASHSHTAAVRLLELRPNLVLEPVCRRARSDLWDQRSHKGIACMLPVVGTRVFVTARPLCIATHNS